MNTLTRFWSAAIVIAGSGACFAADKPAPEEIAKARADCRVQQSRLAQLERNASWCTGDEKLLQVRDAAEHSCGHAEDLLIAAGIEPKPVKPRPAPEVPQLVIKETVRKDVPAQQTASAEPVAQFAAMEVDRRCENDGAKRR